MSVPRLLGHRGASAVAPENTADAIRRALEDGADGVEVDVRVLRDGTAVLHHDETLERTAGDAAAIADLGAESLDARIPRLDDVLDEHLGRTFLALELKVDLPDAAWSALDARHHALPEAEWIVASFRAPILERARDRLPAVRRVLVLRQGQSPPSPEEAAALGLWGLFARHEDVDERFVVEARRAGLAAFAYTVNDPEDLARLVDLGLEGILSDDPGSLRPLLPRRADGG